MRLAKALVVDDSKVVQFKLSKMLQARGLGVHAAGSGQEALDYLTSNTPDVIFMDYMMSGMCGYETTSLITANPVTAAIPVIMCTGEDTPEARARAQDNGASGFIVKPVEDHVLDQVLVTLQEKASARGRAAKAIPLSPPGASIAMAGEDPARMIERVARETTERVVREAIDSVTAAAEQRAQSVAETSAGKAAQDVLAEWRVERASAQERAEAAAVIAAERTVQLAVRAALEAIEATRHTIDAATREATASAVAAAREAAEERGRAAVSDVRRVAESLAGESQAAARLVVENASRDMLQSTRDTLQAARAILQEEHRDATEAVAASVAETVARQICEQVTRDAMDAAAATEAAAREQWQQRAIAAAERAAVEILERSLSNAKPDPSIAERPSEATLDVGVLEASELAPVSEADRAVAPMSAARVVDQPDRVSAGAEGGVADGVRPRTQFSPMQKVLLPWLAGLTAVVLYLLTRI